ncbi:MAG: Gfo/Idh/MocA family oxidoreductase [Planctomycetota bacterium]|nr:Gfo/Idh/MocA family oxidoreductase [Planctomycetota bacterium]
MNRRQFLQSTAAATTSLLVSSPSFAQSTSDPLNIALIGVGEQGRNLMQSAIEIPNLRIRAVCDIWPYRRKPAIDFLDIYKHKAAEYSDLAEMLEKEKDLHAAIIATPDFLHAPQSIACLKAGLHVYCEKPTADSPDAARAMIQTARQANRLLQIGYQRRSNPRYLHVHQKLLTEANLPGRLTHINAQWTTPLREDLGFPKRALIPDDELRRHGYASMHEFRNWRHFRKYTPGLFADLGIHQIDVSNWFLNATPRSIFASASLDYYKGREHPDNLFSILEYDTPIGLVRASYQILTTTSAGAGPSEHFMGPQGSIRISEDHRGTKIYREPYAPDWDRYVNLHYLNKEQPANALRDQTQDPNAIKVQETGQLTRYDLPITLDKPPHQYHLENFFASIRGQSQLTCPATTAFATEAALWKANQSIATKSMLAFAPADFTA